MTWSKPPDPAQDAGAATLGSQKLLRPNSSTVGSRLVQLAEETDMPSMPRNAKNDCACKVVRPIASPSTWKSVAFSDAEGVTPPQGAVSALFMLPPSGGGIFTMKCAAESDVKTRLSRNVSLNEAMTDVARRNPWLALKFEE
jgi:hypothetical protein